MGMVGVEPTQPEATGLQPVTTLQRRRIPLVHSCQDWIRTNITSFRGLRPTVRRPGIRGKGGFPRTGPLPCTCVTRVTAPPSPRHSEALPRALLFASWVRWGLATSGLPNKLHRLYDEAPPSTGFLNEPAPVAAIADGHLLRGANAIE
jgi:hypothetical protein